MGGWVGVCVCCLIVSGKTKVEVLLFVQPGTGGCKTGAGIFVAVANSAWVAKSCCAYKEVVGY